MEQCPKCGKSKSASQASFTQWILICSCDELKPAQEEAAAAEICEACGLQIKQSKSGTLTQWIFSSHHCQCPVPRPRTPGPGSLPDSSQAAINQQKDSGRQPNPNVSSGKEATGSEALASIQRSEEHTS